MLISLPRVYGASITVSLKAVRGCRRQKTAPENDESPGADNYALFT